MALPHGGYGDSAQPFMVLPTKSCRQKSFAAFAARSVSVLYQRSQILTRHARARRGHPRLKARVESKTWMAGTSPAMTTRTGHAQPRLVLSIDFDNFVTEPTIRRRTFKFRFPARRGRVAG